MPLPAAAGPGRTRMRAMAGRIRQSDVEEVKARTNIADIVGEHVSLKSAGVGSLKGLCPFHDERSPSFHVSPGLGYSHCFGCGESGDVYSFLQRMDHVSFTEAVERLGSPEAEVGRRFLGERGFDAEAARRFGVGFAPKSWDALTNHLKARGFSTEELAASGLVSQGDRGVYDRFRGRLVWPIRDVTGQTVGFGARRLFDDDQGPKYLNTPETAIYHKSQVLYGLDLAKRDIAKTHRVVVVEGYTDVMACHLAGVTTAIATSGTSFGVEHIKVLRRVLGDDSGLGEVVFTFDGDAAGQQAAMRAFAEEQRFAAQTFVAVAPDGLDPCDLRLARGDAAVRTLVDSRTPLFDFVIRHTLARHDLETVEGRVAALRAAAPIVAEMRDPAMRPGYTRELARMLGVELAEVTRAVRSASSRATGSAGERGTSAASDSTTRSSSTTTATDAPERPFSITDLPNDPSTRLERDALQAMLQYPETLGPDLLRHAADSRFGNASLAVIRDGIASVLASPDPVVRVDRVMAEVPAPFAGVVQQLAVAPVPQRSEAELAAYVQGVVSALVDRELLRQKAELLGRLQRTDRTDQATFTALQHALVELETERRALRAE